MISTNKLYALLLVITSVILPLQAQQSDLETKLYELPDVIFKKIETEENAELVYELKIKQPLDHANPKKGFFYQKVYLSHKSFASPTVISTNGYAVNRNYELEIATLLHANQVNVEHRFFGESMPDSMDYQYLNLKQATADLHHIRQLLGDLYQGKWVSTGISKGGATTIFYRYFYPNDVDVSVPYVAPINTSYEEQRLYHFLDTIGSDECRNMIRTFQIEALKRRDQIIPLLKFYSMGANLHFTYQSYGEAFEYAVMEYPYAFWQYGSSCKEIPDETATTDEITQQLITVGYFPLFSDELIERYSSHYYQAATEMGYYGYKTSDFKDYLVDLPTDTNPMSLFFPFEMTDKFDGSLLNEVNKWVKTEGNKMIYIYGAIDTWSASAVQPNDQVDSEWFFLKGKHHGNARISEMTDEEKVRLVTTLERWLGIEIE